MALQGPLVTRQKSQQLLVQLAECAPNASSYFSPLVFANRRFLPRHHSTKYTIVDTLNPTHQNQLERDNQTYA